LDDLLLSDYPLYSFPGEVLAVLLLSSLVVVVVVKLSPLLFEPADYDEF
jgi:hypothetical protein